MSVLGGLFGSGGKEIKTTTQTGRAMDLRTAVEGGLGGGMLVGPEAQLPTGGISTKTGDFSPLTQTITGNKFRVGMTSTEVKGLLEQQAATGLAALGAVRDFSQSALSAAVQARTGEPSDLGRYVPYLIVGIVALAVIRRRS